MRCTNCQWKYPEQILADMDVSGTITHNVCGICALEMSNRTLKHQRTEFNGERAEACRLAAIEWRRTHPQDGPVVH